MEGNKGLILIFMILTVFIIYLAVSDRLRLTIDTIRSAFHDGQTITKNIKPVTGGGGNDGGAYSW